MTKLPDQFIQDRALRDSARAVILADVEHAKVSFSAKGVAGRVGGRIGDGAKDVYEVAKVHSDDNRGIIAALIGAVLLWLAREPIFEILGFEPEDAAGEDQDEETGADTDQEQADPSTDETTPADDNPLGDNDEQ